MIKINEKISIDESLISFQYSRSSGPGGQNVNKVNTRVELFFDFENCDSLNSFYKNLIRTKLRKRISADGRIRIVSQQFRSQLANKEAGLNLLISVLADAIKILPKRRKTKIPYSNKVKRLENKAHRAKIKRMRSKKIDDN